jgi:hypothetical protein
VHGQQGIKMVSSVVSYFVLTRVLVLLDARGVLRQLIKKSRKVQSILKKISTAGLDDKEQHKQRFLFFFRKKKTLGVRFTLPVDEQAQIEQAQQVVPSKHFERVRMRNATLPKVLVYASA